ncbi:hypothetical protein Tco_1517933 [Tanacetum coccineum]
MTIKWNARAMGEPLSFEGALASRLDLFKPSLLRVHDFLEKRTPEIQLYAISKYILSGFFEVVIPFHTFKVGPFSWLLKPIQALFVFVALKELMQSISRDTRGSCPGDGVQHNGGVQTPIIDNRGGYTDANTGDVCSSVAMSNMECVNNYTTFGNSFVDVVDFLMHYHIDLSVVSLLAVVIQQHKLLYQQY